MCYCPVQGNFGFVTKLGFNVYMSETDFLTAKMPVMNIIFISLSMCGRPAGVKSFSSSTGHLIKKKRDSLRSAEEVEACDLGAGCSNP